MRSASGSSRSTNDRLLASRASSARRSGGAGPTQIPGLDCVVLALPCVPPRWDKTLVWMRGAPVPDRASPRPRSILVVDDEPGIRGLVARVLAAEGYRITAASDVPSAIRALEGSRFAAVLTDLRMPGPRGLVLVEEVERRGLRTPVVLTSGSLGEFDGLDPRVDRPGDAPEPDPGPDRCLPLSSSERYRLRLVEEPARRRATEGPRQRLTRIGHPLRNDGHRGVDLGLRVIGCRASGRRADGRSKAGCEELVSRRRVGPRRRALGPKGV